MVVQEIRTKAISTIASTWKNDTIVWMFDFEINPRVTVLKNIVKLFPNHPQTLDLLIDRAKNDPDEKIREFAGKTLKRFDQGY